MYGVKDESFWFDRLFFFQRVNVLFLSKDGILFGHFTQLPVKIKKNEQKIGKFDRNVLIFLPKRDMIKTAEKGDRKMENKQYACIDLKSFFASVECVERGLDPMTTNLVVADVKRTEKTICLAVTPPLKAHGISGRARLFEVIAQLKIVNAKRQQSAPMRQLTGTSWDDRVLKRNPTLRVDYIAAPPRMGKYIEYSTRIYQIYLKYVAPEDIHVYSIDEVFIDLTPYLKVNGMTARQMVSVMVADVLATTGITAAAGIGTNLYLAKIAMDIEAKHAEADRNGVRIAELDEMTYRMKLWSHRPLTDFWRIGGGYARRLEQQGLYTMGDVARCSLGKAGGLL